MEDKLRTKSKTLTIVLFVVAFVLTSFLLDFCTGAVNRMLYEAQKTDPVEVAQAESMSMLNGRFSMAMPEGMELLQDELFCTADSAHYFRSNASGRTDGSLSVSGHQHPPTIDADILACTMIYDLDGDEGYTYENAEEGCLPNGHIIISADKVYENSMKSTEKHIVFVCDDNYMVQVTLDGFDQEYMNSVADSITVN